MEKVLVSACLLRHKVRHDGRDKPLADARFEHWLAEGRLVAFCPEVAAGFGVPRPPAEIEEGAGGEAVLDGRARVVERGGRDVTDLFIAGAQAALQCARSQGVRFALLTDASPSCGSRVIHDGGFAGRTVPGEGVTAALLRQNGLRVFAHDEVDGLAAALRDER